MVGRPKIDRVLQEAERKLAEMEEGLLAAYELTEMCRLKVVVQRKKVKSLKQKKV